jgi:hypothetical protein
MELKSGSKKATVYLEPENSKKGVIGSIPVEDSTLQGAEMR